MGRAISQLAAGLSLFIGAAALAQSGLTPLDSGGAGKPPPPWRVVGLPSDNKGKPYTQFTLESVDGQRALKIDADRSYGNLVHNLAETKPVGKLSWRWRVDVANDKADLKAKGGDDRVLEICAAFALPLDKVPFLDRQTLKLAGSLSSEPIPPASVCYTWDIMQPTGTVLDNAFSRRKRMIIVRGSGSPLKTWSTETRDLGADFLKLFGDEAKEVPPLIGLSIGGDTDNTQLHTLGWIADLELRP